jgi:Glycosyltransferase family 87
MREGSLLAARPVYTVAPTDAVLTRCAVAFLAASSAPRLQWFGVTRVSLVAVLESRRARVGTVVLWAISVTILLFGALHKTHRPNGNDFTMYLQATDALFAGKSPYSMTAAMHYMYPLFLAAVLGPLATVPRDLATTVWFLTSIASLVGAARVVVGLARASGVIRADVPTIVPLVALWFLLWDPIQNDLLNGQVNFPILLLCVLSLGACLERRTLGSAFPLAAAIAVKLNPALLLGFLAARRRWAAIALCLGVAAALVLAPLMFIGEGLAPYANYLQSVLLVRVHGEYPIHQGVSFSVNGMLEKIAPDWGRAPWQRALGGSLPLVGLAVVEIVSRRRRAPGREIWVFCLYLIALLLVTPISEVHHLVYAFPALGLLLLASVLGEPASPGPRRLGGGLACCLLLFGGWVARGGPWFFLALCLLAGLVASEAVVRAHPRETGSRASE